MTVEDRSNLNRMLNNYIYRNGYAYCEEMLHDGKRYGLSETELEMSVKYFNILLENGLIEKANYGFNIGMITPKGRSFYNNGGYRIL